MAAIDNLKLIMLAQRSELRPESPDRSSPCIHAWLNRDESLRFVITVWMPCNEHLRRVDEERELIVFRADIISIAAVLVLIQTNIVTATSRVEYHLPEDRKFRLTGVVDRQTTAGARQVWHMSGREHSIAAQQKLIGA